MFYVSSPPLINQSRIVYIKNVYIKIDIYCWHVHVSILAKTQFHTDTFINHVLYKHYRHYRIEAINISNMQDLNESSVII